MKHALLISISAFALYTSPVIAADLSPEKGAELKASLDNMMEHFTTVSTDITGFHFDGETIVTPKEKYFRATLPNITLKGSDGSFLDIGKIRINAVPVEKNDTQWKLAVSLPKTMMGYSDKNIPMAKIVIPEQKAIGVFDNRINYFTQIKASYDNIKVENLGDKVSIKIPNISLKHNWQEDENGFFSGPSDYSMTGLEIKDEKKEDIIKVGHIGMTGEFKGYDFASYKKVKELTNDMLSETAGDSPEELNPNTLFTLLTESYFKSSDAFSFSVNGKDITLRTPKKEEETSGQTTTSENIQIDDFTFGMGMEDLRKEHSDINFNLGYTVPQSLLSSQADETRKILPNKTNISISLEKVPVKDMIEKGEKSIKVTSAEQGNIKSSLKMQAMMLLPEMLTNAGTKIEIKDISLEGNGYGANITGTAHANAQAAKMATAKINGEVNGLGQLIQSIKASSANNPGAGMILGPLSMVQMMGQQKGEGDIRTYDFKLTETGQMILNGTDLATMFPKKAAQ